MFENINFIIYKFINTDIELEKMFTEFVNQHILFSDHHAFVNGCVDVCFPCDWGQLD